MRFSKLVWPAGLNLSILSEVLSEDELINLIRKYQGKNRFERRIILPSKKCVLKVISHYLVEKHKGNYGAVMKELKKRGRWKTLKEASLSRKRIRELYEQRCKEIENEKEKN